MGEEPGSGPVFVQTSRMKVALSSKARGPLPGRTDILHSCMESAGPWARRVLGDWFVYVILVVVLFLV